MTLGWLRYCSSVSHSFKTEAAGGSTIVREPLIQTSSLDFPPVLFIAKYNRLIDTADFSKTITPLVSAEHHPEIEEKFEESNWSPQSLTQKKVKFILEAVQHTKTFESLSERLKECPSALFETPPKAVGVDYVRDHLFVDEEHISNNARKSDGLVLKESSVTEADDLLHWTSVKLDLRKLPTYYMMLSKFRLTLLVNIFYIVN